MRTIEIRVPDSLYQRAAEERIDLRAHAARAVREAVRSGSAREARVTFVGLCPGRRGRSWDVESDSTRRLARLVDRTAEELREDFHLVNLSKERQATRAALRRGAEAIALCQSERFVLLGCEVARAFGRRAWPVGASEAPGLAVWYRCREGALILRIPHPSGRNRALNDRRLTRLVRRALSSL